MPRPAIVTEDVTREPGEEVVVLGDLLQLWPVAPLSATVANGALIAGDLGTDEV
jgi:hypothetical protein